eukprot:2020609-Rhodomonas_salina.5
MRSGRSTGTGMGGVQTADSGREVGKGWEGRRDVEGGREGGSPTVSRLNSCRSCPAAARRSPFVNAPRDCNRFATAAANRRSPPRSVTTKR